MVMATSDLRREIEQGLRNEGSDDPGSRRRFLLSTIVGATTLTAGCVGDGDDADDQPDHDGPVIIVGPAHISAGDPARQIFEPEEAVIPAGEEVLFIWETDHHSIEVVEQPEDASWEGLPEFYDEGHEYRHVFEVEGRYVYECGFHMGMRAELIVE